MGKPAATIGDHHICPKSDGNKPHVGGPILEGATNVFIGGKPAAREGDKATCVGPPDTIREGSPTVRINGKPAAFLGSQTVHNGKVMAGNPTVRIGKKAPSHLTSLFTPEGYKPYTGPYREPNTLGEAEGRLNIADSYHLDHGGAESYTPRYSDQELEAMAEQGEVEERFIVRIVESGWAGDDKNLGPPMKGDDARYWSTTFSCAEKCGGDPRLYCQSLGMDYDPKKDYTIMIVDTEAQAKDGNGYTIVPTYSALGGFAKKELDAMEPEAVDAVMTPEYSKEYVELREAFDEDPVERNIRSKNDRKAFADQLPDGEASQHFNTRGKLEAALGANQWYTGDGMTQYLGSGEPDRQHGALETWTYDRNPKPLGDMSGLARIKAEPMEKKYA